MFLCTHHIPAAGFVPILSLFINLGMQKSLREGLLLVQGAGTGWEIQRKIFPAAPSDATGATHPLFASSRSFPWKTSGFLG